ncbi:MAG: hypothetical protein M0C28_43950 [Candidatus Moduliflexus flocculans]|nr:hypothetical protein [Candidatus Moduliflexus flocculans]
MEGGFVQGMSSALFESLQAEGWRGAEPQLCGLPHRHLHGHARQISRPSSSKCAQDDGPWGARGIGEHSMVPTIPAIANAIYDAIGIRFDGPPFAVPGDAKRIVTLAHAWTMPGQVVERAFRIWMQS